MKLKAISILLIATSAVLATAQVAPTNPIGVGARIGAFFPTDSTTQNAGNTWLDLGIDFQVKKLTPSASLSVSLDYAYRQDFRSVPLLLNYVLKKGSIYLLAGAGGNFSRFENGDGSIDSKTSFSYDAGIGYDLTSGGGTPIFVEGRYFGSSQSALNGFGAFIGIRL